MRAGKSSKLVSVAAVLCLIAISLLMIDAFDSASLANPLIPLGNGGPNGSGPNVHEPVLPNGTLAVDLSSNQNGSDARSNPTDRSLPLAGWPVSVTAANTSFPFTEQYSLVTNRGGVASQQLPEGSYAVQILDETLNVTIPVQVFAGNETSVEVRVTGTLYPLLYSEESGVLLTPSSAQYGMYVEFRSSTPVANVSEPVILKVLEGTAGAEYVVNATVLSQQPPAQGTQWVELGTASAVDPLDATSISVITWTCSTSVTTGPILPGGFPVNI